MYKQPAIVPNVHNLPTLSVSRVKMYRTCARKYYLRYILPKDQRPEEQKNIYALKGTALHASIEAYYTLYNKDADEVKALNKALGVYQETLLTTLSTWQEEAPVVGEEYAGAALKDGKEILRKLSYHTLVPDVMEYRFALPFPNAESPICWMEGIIDMITKDGTIVDHKSNSKAPSEKDLKQDPQFLVYRWAYEQIYGSAPYRVVWHHLKTGEFFPVDLSDYDVLLDRFTGDVQDLVSRVFTIPPARRLLDQECKQCMFFSTCY